MSYVVEVVQLCKCQLNCLASGFFICKMRTRAVYKLNEGSEHTSEPIYTQKNTVQRDHIAKCYNS